LKEAKKGKITETSMPEGEEKGVTPSENDFNKRIRKRGRGKPFRVGGSWGGGVPKKGEKKM